MNSKTRIRYLDTLKLLAIFIVFVTHFINRFNDSYFSLWHEAPTSWVLNGVTGKMGVAVFAVILGYFAYKSKEPSIARYTIKRYIYFLLCGLFINTVYAAFGNLGIFDDAFSAKAVIINSLTLGAGIFRTFWCIRPFFISSVLSRLNGKFKAGPVIVLIEMAAAYKLSGDVWISICLMGDLVAMAMANEKLMSIFRYVWVRWPVYAIVFFAIKRPESSLTYVIDGLSASLIILALSESRRIRKVLEWEPLAAQGKNTMAMYLVHVVVYRLVGMAAGLDESSPGAFFLLIMAVSWALVVTLSFPLTKLLDLLTKICMKPVDAVLQYTDDIFDDGRCEMDDVERKLLKKGWSIKIYPADFVWGAAMCAMFALCLELFYRMAVNYKHKYPSDLYYYAVQNPQTHDERGRFIGELFDFLYHINGGEVFEIAVFLAFLIVGIIIANYMVIYFFVKDDGCLDKVPRYAMQFFSVAMLFMGAIYVPVIFERYYLHTFKAWAWHSPTQQAMTFFALLGSLCFLRMYLDYEEKGVHPGYWLGTAVLMFFSTWSKPAFMINLIFAVVIMFIIDLIRGGKEGFGKRFAKLFVMGCSLIPSGLYILWLHNASFTEGTQYGEEHSVVIGFSQVLEYDNLLGAIIFGVTIPIVVFALNAERFRDKKYRFALYVFVMGMVQWMMFTETGRRGNYGNFTWGRMYGIYFLTLAAAVVFMETLYDKEGKYAGRNGRRIACLIVMGMVIAWAILSQLNYFRLILTGHGYQL